MENDGQSSTCMLSNKPENEYLSLVIEANLCLTSNVENVIGLDNAHQVYILAHI